MSPRKTRRAVKTENIDESSLETTVNSSKPQDSPVIFLRSARTRRLKNSNDSDGDQLDQSPSLNKTKRSAKKSKTRKLLNATTSEVTDVSIDNLTVSSAKKQNRKAKEAAIIIENSTINNNINENDDDDIIIVERKTTRSRKKGNSIIIDLDKEISDKKIDKVIVKNEILEEKDSIEDNEVANVSEKKNYSPPSNTRFRQLRDRSTNSPNVINTTPESSPITVNLTPHRTTKTPRKSPVNIGSPKTHSLSPQKISKTPRKLPVMSTSPAPSEQSSSGETPNKIEKYSSKKKKDVTEIPSKKKSPKNSSLLLNISRTSKTPRINLRRSKSKSPKSKSPTKVKKFTPKKSPTKRKNTPDAKIIEAVINRGSPQLILERVSLKFSPKIKSNIQTSTDKKKDVSSQNVINLRKNLETDFPEKPSSNDEPLTPIRPILTSRFHSISKGSSPQQLGARTIQNKLSSSTPREKGRRSLNLDENSVLSVDTFYGSSPRTSTQIYDVKIDDETNPLISEDNSFEISGIKRTDDSTIVNENDEVKKNGTYEVDEPKTPSLKKKKVDNDTYELDEPKTPALKKRVAKRSLNEDKKSEEVVPKKTFRVTFASPDDEEKVISKQNTRSRLATPKHVLKNSTDTLSNSHRRRSNSMSSLSVRTPNSREKTRSSSVVDVNRGKSSAIKSQNESVNRLSRPRQSLTAEKKKPENIKPLSARKIPNFSQIHQKKFEKMESLVDVKKRIEERHNVLTKNVPSLNESKKMNNGQTVEVEKTATKTAPKKPANNSYTRFGFKLRKTEATQQIVSKQPAKKKITEKKEEKRQILRGVRSNRRFELMMKSRKIE